MKEYIAELSKYMITLLLAVYALESFLSFRFSKKGALNGIYIRQRIYLLLIQFLAFFTMTVRAHDMQYLFFYAYVQVFLFALMSVTGLIYEKADKLLLNNMCMLLGIGFIILARISLKKAEKQLAVALLSFLIALAVPFLVKQLRFLKKGAWLYAAIGAGMLSTVLILGGLTYGAKISFTVQGITFQPSELVKLLFVFFLASALCENTSFVRLVITTALAAAHVIILVLSRDLGSALIFFAAYVFVVFMATGSYLYLTLGIAAFGGSAVASCYLFDHVRNRVMIFLDPFSYIDAQGYQLTQSLFSVCSGSWFGLGLFGGTPEDIPFVETDFIFSAICEELGVISGICIVLICVGSFLLMLRIGMQSKDSFLRLLAYGCAVMYLFQIFLTIGGGVKFIPLTGVTLPLVSYGGSSVLSTVLLFFIVQAVAVNRQKDTAPVTGSVYVLMYFFVALFLAMMGYLVWFVKNNEQTLINNSYNSRQEMLASQNYRGSIYAAGGEVLAETVFLPDGTEQRQYPYGDKFAHVVGFSTKGRMGVESQANYYLINTNIPLTQKVSNDMAGIKNPGDNVYTTLDVALQEAAYRELGTYKGAIIVTEVSTGKVLAMVSNPAFDPNEIADIWDKLVEDADSSVLVNRATQGLYPPGSTFKILTALEYIRENPDTWQDYRYTCNGHFKEGEWQISCYHGISHGKLDFTKSFAKSCNSSFSNIGLSLDLARFSDTLQDMLFNQELPVSFLYAKSHILLSEEMDTPDVMQLVIGQGTTQITPLHLNMITAAVANGGVMMKPYVVDRVESANGVLVKRFSPAGGIRVMSEEESLVLTGLMRAVVEEGTATKISGLSYTVAGKTGSAEYSNVKGESHAWFTGFAPADDPQICVTVILEGAGSGGDYAVPMAKRVFNAYFE